MEGEIIDSLFREFKCSIFLMRIENRDRLEMNFYSDRKFISDNKRNILKNFLFMDLCCRNDVFEMLLC